MFSYCKYLSLVTRGSTILHNKTLMPLSYANLINFTSRNNISNDEKDSSNSSFGTFKNTSSSRIIFDVDEERQLAINNPEEYQKLYDLPDVADEFEGINISRGITGVYDIEDLVNVLNKQRGIDICVIAVSPELRYVDYIVIVTGKSYKHMSSMASFVRRLFKKKYDPDRGDILPVIEGEKSADWIALDLGNIALHIFSRRARDKYDLESLWCLGRDLDIRSNEIHDEMSVKSFSLDDLSPNEDDLSARELEELCAPKSEN